MGNILRVITALTGLGLVGIGAASLIQNYVYSWFDVAAPLGVAAVGTCVAAYSVASSMRPGRTILGMWIDLKRAEMQQRHDALVRDRGR